MAATIGELSAALANADKVGDLDGARRLAAAITHMQDNGLQLYAEPPKKMGFIDSAIEAVTGEKRKTGTTESLPDWAGMPELNSLSLASAKTGVGTLISSPKETADIIKANYPEAQIRKDEKGNYVIKSSIDGKEYAIKPGFQVSDIPRALGALVAFTPAGRATTIPGMAAASAGTQAVIEASQAATGGEFNPGEVAVAGAVGAAVPTVVKAVQAAKQPVAQALNRLTGKPVPGAAEIPPAAGATPPLAASPGVVPPVAPVAPAAAPITPETVLSRASRITYEDASKLVSGKTEKPGGTDPLKQLGAAASNGKNLYIADVPVSVFRKNEAGARYDGTVKSERALEYANRTPENVPPVIAVVSRDGSQLNILDGGHRLTAARIRGDETVPTIISTKKVQAASVASAQPPVTPPASTITPLPAAELTQTAKAAAGGSNRATEVLAGQTLPDAKTLEAAKRLGIEDYLQPDHVTTNQAYRELAQAVKSVPGSATRVAEIEGLNAIGKRADDLIDTIGGTTDVSALNVKLKTNLQATQSELDKKAEQLYGKLRKAIPAQTEAPAPSVLAFVEQRTADLGGAANLTPLEKTILKKLTPKEIIGADGAITGLKQPTYTLLDDVRRDLGSAGKMTGPFKDADVGLAKKLYGLLSTDQAAIAEANGAGDLFTAAKSAVQIRKGIENDLTALFGKTLDGSIVGDLSGAVKSLPSGDVSRFIRLLKATPESMRQELVATGLNTAFGKATQNGTLNFNTYAKWYDGLLQNKQAYTAVMSNLPGSARKQLSDLYRVSKGVAMATRERITTGRIQAIQQEFQGADSLMGNVYSLAKRSAGTVAAEAVTSGVGLPGAGVAAGIASALTRGAKPNALKAADALISSPEFAQAVKQATTEEGKAAAARLAYSKPFTKFVRAIGNPKELSNRERWILQTLEAQQQGGERK